VEGGIRRGDIWTIQPPAHPKLRPALVISLNAINDLRPDILVIPSTTVPGPTRVRLPNQPAQTGLREVSYAKGETLGPVPTTLFKKRIGALPSDAWPPIKARVLFLIGFDE